MPSNLRTFLKAGAIAIVAAGLFAATAQAGNGGTKNDGLDTPADTIHPNIHANNNAGNNANPNGVNDGGGNMHGIANNPGKADINPNDDGVNGFANQLTTVHGGIDSKNKNAVP
jgi:hypothetical protein